MNLNIKSDEVHRMAVELSRRTGSSITAAVRLALKAQLRRTEGKSDKIARIEALIKRTAPMMRGGPGSQDIDALLYDDKGLPK